MNICHITSAHNRYDDRIFSKECKSLSKNGQTVRLIVHDKLEDEQIDGVSIYSTGETYNSRLKRIFMGNKKIIEMIKDIPMADVYHFHDPELLLLAKKIKKLGAKVIFDSHENYPLQIAQKDYIPLIIRPFASKLYERIEKKLLKYVDASIIPCSFGGKNPLQGKTDIVEYINGYPIKNVFYDYYKKDTQKEDAICYVGSLTEKRGIKNLIKASYLAKVKLILVGEFSNEEYKKDILAMSEMQIVDYKGKLDWNEIRAIYQKVRIGMCVLENCGQYDKADNLATKVYEYMSMGLPVILSETAYIKEILKKYHFGIAVDPDSPQEIAEAIRYLLNNLDTAYEMGLEGRRAIKEEFNWELEEKKLLDLYSKLEI